jgi:sulfatase modifying factor 1
MRQGLRCAVACGLVVSLASAGEALVIPTVPIGSPGNAADPATGSRYGAVAYTYHLGKTEVTNAQYAAFLNAVAVTDPNSLYHTSMGLPGLGQWGGITRTGAAGSYSYATMAGREQWPVNWVSFWDALRFANWLHNGQPAGAQGPTTTEDGAYTLTSAGIASNAITRNSGWIWAVASGDEWYKGAFYQPPAAGGPASGYWTYGTSTNTISQAMANYSGPAPAPVGGYAGNYWGAQDMAGNVWEYNEATFGLSPTGRGLIGGSFVSAANTLQSNFFGPNDASQHWYDYGFRVVAVPAPSAAALVALTGLTLARRRR